MNTRTIEKDVNTFLERISEVAETLVDEDVRVDLRAVNWSGRKKTLFRFGIEVEIIRDRKPKPRSGDGLAHRGGDCVPKALLLGGTSYVVGIGWSSRKNTCK